MSLRFHRSGLARAATIAVAALVAVTTGCSDDGDTTGTTAPPPLSGTFTVTFRSPAADPCTTDPTLTAGTTVVVTDPEGSQLATGTLGTGTAQGAACVLPLELGDVPPSAVYLVQVGGYGPIEVTAEALAASGGTLDLRLGL